MVAPEYCALIRSSRVNDASAKPMQMTAKARMTRRLIRVRSSNVLILASRSGGKSGLQPPEPALKSAMAIMSMGGYMPSSRMTSMLIHSL